VPLLSADGAGCHSDAVEGELSVVVLQEAKTSDQPTT